MTTDTDPVPGRPVSLGRETDLADAATVLAVLRAVTEAEKRGRSIGTGTILRSTVQSVWERPRLPRPLIAHRYPVTYPWSPAAREVYERGGTGLYMRGELIFEHLFPVNALIGALRRRAGAHTPASVIGVLEARLCAAVITRAEDATLREAGLAAHTAIGYAIDPWGRYKAVGFPIADLAPLDVERVGSRPVS